MKFVAWDLLSAIIMPLSTLSLSSANSFTQKWVEMLTFPLFHHALSKWMWNTIFIIDGIWHFLSPLSLKISLTGSWPLGVNHRPTEIVHYTNDLSILCPIRKLTTTMTKITIKATNGPKSRPKLVNIVMTLVIEKKI